MLAQILEMLATLYNYGYSLDYNTLIPVYFVTLGVLLIGLFILKGFGLYRLSIVNGIDTPMLSFVPFASFYQLGKLIGTIYIFKVKFKNVGLLLAILCFVTTVMEYLYDFATYWDTLQRVLNSNSLIAAVDSEGEFIANDAVWLNILRVFSIATNLVYIIIFVFAMIAFFRFYSPRNTMLFSILSAIFRPLFYIFVFAVRKNKKGSFYQTYNPYGGNYSNYGGANNAYRGGAGYNGYSSPSQNAGGQDDSSPFEEYQSDKGFGGGNVFEEYASKTEDTHKEQRPDYTDDDDLFS